MAGDTRLGFATHFDQGWDPLVDLPMIAAMGVGWIRDDMNWATIETVQGVYDFTKLKPFWTAAQARGLGIVAIVGANPIYTDTYDPVGMPNFCAQLALHLPGVVIEVTNEPNNNYQAAEGPTWQTKLVTLTNNVVASVHAVSPSTLVIGLGAQGTQILNMLSAGGHPDGVVYHPYDANDKIPEHAFEPSFTEYVSWVAALRAATTRPIWETEFNIGTGALVTEYVAAAWMARRLLLKYSLNVEHSMIYVFQDTTIQGVLNVNIDATQQYFTILRILDVMNPGVIGVPAEGVAASNTAAGFDAAQYKSVILRSSTRTVAAVWYGDVAPKFAAAVFPRIDPSGGHTNPAGFTIIDISFTVPVTPVFTVQLDPLSGDVTPFSQLNTTKSGNTWTIHGVKLSPSPLIFILDSQPLTGFIDATVII